MARKKVEHTFIKYKINGGIIETDSIDKLREIVKMKTGKIPNDLKTKQTGDKDDMLVSGDNIVSDIIA